MAGKRFTLDLVLSWRGVRGDTTVGWMLGVVWLVNALVGYVCLSLLIALGMRAWDVRWGLDMGMGWDLPWGIRERITD